MTRASTNAAILLSTLALLLAFYAVHDVIPYASGTGYDGGRYAAWAKTMTVRSLAERAGRTWRGEPPVEQGDELLDRYYVHRILPSVAVHYLLTGAGAERSTANVIAGFLWLNVALLLVTVFCWLTGADALNVSARGKWLGVTGLIVSYANLKMPLYYAPLTDTAALAAGAASMLFYLQRRTIALSLVALAGAFVWPTLTFFAALLLAFPRTAEPQPGSPLRRLETALAAVIAVGVFAGIEYLFAVGYEIESVPVRLLVSVRHLSAAIAGLYTFLALRPLLDVRALWSAARRGGLFAGLAVAALVVVSSEALARLIASAPPELGFAEFLENWFFSAAIQPFTFYVAHVLYFGPILIFLLFAWPAVCARIRRLGMGAVAFFAVTALLSLGSESRLLINVLPFAILLLAPSLDNVLGSTARLLTFVVLSVVVSKVWLPMDRTLSLPFVGSVDWRELYLSSRGPWIEHGVYLLQLMLLMPVAVLFYYWWRFPLAGEAPTPPKLVWR